MGNIFSWQVSKLEKTQKHVGFSDVVSFIHWRRIIVGLDGNRSSRYATFKCPAPSQSNFIPFNELNDEIIFSWLDGFIDYNSIDLELEQDLLSIDLEE